MLLPTALRLPTPDIEALIEGRTIAAMPGIFVNPGRQFALYPSEISTNILPIEQYYRPNFLPTAQKALAQLNSETVTIKAWAKCQLCQIIDTAEGFDILSQLTVWTEEALQQTLKLRGNIFLAYLRVYLLPQPLEMPVHPSPRFVPLPQPLTVTQTTPALNNTFFQQRSEQMQNRQPPFHPELEELQSAIAQLADTNLAAKELDQDLKVFLGWSSQESFHQLNSDLIWIKKIAEVGNSSNGQEFEKLVRKSFLKLGFTNSRHDPKASLDPEATGGAGGIDFYCDAPYPVVGECKATKTEKVTDKTPAQLLKIGMNHLGKDQYDLSIKIIVAAGELNSYALRTATQNQMNVISPETLQKLVELKAAYQGAIDLLKLKKCLQKAPFGLVDEQVNRVIDKIRHDIKVRAHIVKLVKNYQEKTGNDQMRVHAIYGAYALSDPPQPLKSEEMRDILVELASPLTGYLGRNKGFDGSDRFYFLRDLTIN